MSIPRSKHYYKSKKDSKKDLAILDMIKDIALDFPLYGYRRITAVLRREAMIVNHKKVYRIMAQNGICCSIRRSYKHTTNSKHDLGKYPNLIKNLIPCGDCDYCKMGQVNMCKNVLSVGEDTDGIFAEYYVAKRSLLYHLHSNVDLDIAIFAEPLACALNGFKRLCFVPGQLVMILGAGPIGLLFSKLANAAGAGIVSMTEKAPFRVNFARQNAKADRIIDVTSENIDEVIKQMTGEVDVDVLIDTVGTQIVTAIKYAAYEGKILLFGINDSVSQTIKQYEITRKELTLVSNYATFNTFPIVEKMLAYDVLDLKNLLTHKVELKDLPEGIEMLRRGEALKVVVYPSK